MGIIYLFRRSTRSKRPVAPDSKDIGDGGNGNNSSNNDSARQSTGIEQTTHDCDSGCTSASSVTTPVRKLLPPPPMHKSLVARDPPSNRPAAQETTKEKAGSTPTAVPQCDYWPKSSSHIGMPNSRKSSACLPETRLVLPAPPLQPVPVIPAEFAGSKAVFEDGLSPASPKVDLGLFETAKKPASSNNSENNADEAAQCGDDTSACLQQQQPQYRAAAYLSSNASTTTPGGVATSPSPIAMSTSIADKSNDSGHATASPEHKSMPVVPTSPDRSRYRQVHEHSHGATASQCSWSEGQLAATSTTSPSPQHVLAKTQEPREEGCAPANSCSRNKDPPMLHLALAAPACRLHGTTSSDVDKNDVLVTSEYRSPSSPHYHHHQDIEYAPPISLASSVLDLESGAFDISHENSSIDRLPPIRQSTSTASASLPSNKHAIIEDSPTIAAITPRTTVTFAAGHSRHCSPSRAASLASKPGNGFKNTYRQQSSTQWSSSAVQTSFDCFASSPLFSTEEHRNQLPVTARSGAADSKLPLPLINTGFPGETNPIALFSDLQRQLHAHNPTQQPHVQDFTDTTTTTTTINNNNSDTPGMGTFTSLLSIDSYLSGHDYHQFRVADSSELSASSGGGDDDDGGSKVDRTSSVASSKPLPSSLLPQLSLPSLPPAEHESALSLQDSASVTQSSDTDTTSTASSASTSNAYDRRGTKCKGQCQGRLVRTQIKKGRPFTRKELARKAVEKEARAKEEARRIEEQRNRRKELIQQRLAFERMKERHKRSIKTGGKLHQATVPAVTQSPVPVRQVPQTAAGSSAVHSAMPRHVQLQPLQPGIIHCANIPTTTFPQRKSQQAQLPSGMMRRTSVSGKGPTGNGGGTTQVSRSSSHRHRPHHNFTEPGAASSNNFARAKNNTNNGPMAASPKPKPTTNGGIPQHPTQQRVPNPASVPSPSPTHCSIQAASLHSQPSPQQLSLLPIILTDSPQAAGPGSSMASDTTATTTPMHARPQSRTDQHQPQETTNDSPKNSGVSGVSLPASVPSQYGIPSYSKYSDFDKVIHEACGVQSSSSNNNSDSDRLPISIPSVREGGDNNDAGAPSSRCRSGSSDGGDSVSSHGTQGSSSKKVRFRDTVSVVFNSRHTEDDEAESGDESARKDGQKRISSFVSHSIVMLPSATQYSSKISIGSDAESEDEDFTGNLYNLFGSLLVDEGGFDGEGEVGRGVHSLELERARTATRKEHCRENGSSGTRHRAWHHIVEKQPLRDREAEWELERRQAKERRLQEYRMRKGAAGYALGDDDDDDDYDDDDDDDESDAGYSNYATYLRGAAGSKLRPRRWYSLGNRPHYYQRQQRLHEANIQAMNGHYPTPACSRRANGHEGKLQSIPRVSSPIGPPAMVMYPLIAMIPSSKSESQGILSSASSTASSTSGDTVISSRSTPLKTANTEDGRSWHGQAQLLTVNSNASTCVPDDDVQPIAPLGLADSNNQAKYSSCTSFAASGKTNNASRVSMGDSDDDSDNMPLSMLTNASKSSLHRSASLASSTPPEKHRLYRFKWIGSRRQSSSVRSFASSSNAGHSESSSKMGSQSTKADSNAPLTPISESGEKTSTRDLMPGRWMRFGSLSRMFRIRSLPSPSL